MFFTHECGRKFKINDVWSRKLLRKMSKFVIAKRERKPADPKQKCHAKFKLLCTTGSRKKKKTPKKIFCGLI